MDLKILSGKNIIILISLFLLVAAAGCTRSEKTAGDSENMATKVLLKTNQGDIVIELDKNMPVTAGNFEKLVKQGYYDGVIFHRVIDGFMI